MPQRRPPGACLCDSPQVPDGVAFLCYQGDGRRRASYRRRTHSKGPGNVGLLAPGPSQSAISCSLPLSPGFLSLMPLLDSFKCLLRGPESQQHRLSMAHGVSVSCSSSGPAWGSTEGNRGDTATLCPSGVLCIHRAGGRLWRRHLGRQSPSLPRRMPSVIFMTHPSCLPPCPCLSITLVNQENGPREAARTRGGTGSATRVLPRWSDDSPAPSGETCPPA